MQQRLAELLSYMDSTRAGLLTTVSNLNPSFAGVRPRGESWSAADNLAHLALVEERIARLVEEGVEWAKANDVGPEASDLISECALAVTAGPDGVAVVVTSALWPPLPRLRRPGGLMSRPS